MGRFFLILLKIVVGLILLLVVLIGLTLLAGYYYLDPNLYKDQIITLVKEQTGRDLTINSRIEKSIYPFLGLKMGELSLSNAAEFADSGQFLEIEKVQIGVRLMPIFKGRIEADKIRVSGLQVNLGKNEAGLGSWEDLLRLIDSEEDADTADIANEADQNGDDTSQPLTFSFQGIELINAGLNWKDATTGQDIRISEFDVVISLSELHKPFPINIKGRFDAQQPKFSGALKLTTEVLLSENFDEVSLNGTQLELQVKGDSLPEKGIDLQLKTAVRINTDSLSLALDPLALSVGGIELAGAIQIKSEEALTVKGAMALAQTNPRDVLTSLGMALPVTANPKALSSLAGTFGFVATPTGVDVEVTALTFDDSSLQGTLAILLGDAPAYRFNLVLDQLNLDDYLPPKQDDKQDATKKTEPFSLDPALVDSLRDMNVAGEAHLQKLIANGLTVKNIKLLLTARNGQVKIGPVAADLYEGQLSGSTQLDFRQNTPAYALNHQLQNFEIGPFTQDLLGKERVSGKTQLMLDLNSAGMNLDEIKRSLNGQIEFALKDGAVVGINIAQMLRDAQAKLKGKSESAAKEPAPTEPLETDFSALTGVINARYGVLENDNLTAYSPLLRVNGKGTLNLIAEQVDYLLTTSLVGTIKGQGGAELDELRGISIPVRVSGPMLEPKFSLDLQAALQQKAADKLKPKIEEKKEELQKEILKRVPEQWRSLIK